MGTQSAHSPRGMLKRDLEKNQLSNQNDSLHQYLTGVVHVDIWWFIGSRLDQAPSTLPRVDTPILGSSTVPWRYHFNTGNSSILREYDFAF